ncbi:thiamine diphosphokinase [Ligilactobacillus pobuzihii]|uniref:Thiamine diphosphokinase n=1 Tax=Ligilactobacillus pobuzihii TaxID=449659 RepID=A0A0R2LLX0_9LACO|nr:thiamine diphosphokinase [Ligilactobacillus pobuzihii]KRK11317.1 thiamin pyrophosphokinase [Ligilactobacillus pobuzihii E100301 = KCTC 13174]KRO02632.1 thiamin pyrophosphokinase [Ligilactobacillus pobuzihii]GEN47416.1 thiamine pyrophosphokinase [Ligilactobacillus pobuzihii]
MIVNLLVGGPTSDWPTDLADHLLNPANADEVWVGADYGAVRLIKAGIRPVLSVGDFDSSSEKEIELVRQNSDKSVIRPKKEDVTDTMLALRYIISDLDFEKIVIYGATGARLDQLLSNLFFVLMAEFKPYCEQIEIVDRWNHLNFYLPGHHELAKLPSTRYLAFICLNAVSDLYLYDAKYQLAGVDFAEPISLSSNEFVGNSTNFSFDSGVICTIQSHD